MRLSREREFDSVIAIVHTIWLQILNYHSEAFQNQVSPRPEVTGPLHMTCVCILFGSIKIPRVIYCVGPNPLTQILGFGRGRESTNI